MALKKIFYNDLSINKNNVYSKILQLMQNVKKINKEIDYLTQDEIWEGQASEKFVNLSKNIIKFNKNKILDFENTNEYKQMVINSSSEAETKSIGLFGDLK